MERVVGILDEHGWATCTYHGCFDVVARKRRLMLLKILSNVDALEKHSAKNMKTISANMDAAALVIGESTSRERLEEGVVYERFELPTISIDTFEAIITANVMPVIYSDRGGLYVEIEPELLRSARQKSKLTQAELAEAVGINKKSIYCYERGRTRAVLSVVQKLEKILNKRVSCSTDVLKSATMSSTVPKDGLEKAVADALAELGFATDFVGQAPFDVFAREKTLLLSDVENDRRAMLKRAPALKRFVETVREPALLITERSRDVEIFGIPVVKRDEISEFGSPRELLRVAKKAA